MTRSFVIIATAAAILISALAFIMGSGAGSHSPAPGDAGEGADAGYGGTSPDDRMEIRRKTRRMLTEEPSPEEGKRRLIMKNVTFSEESLAPLDQRSLSNLLREMADLSDESGMQFDINRMLRSMGLNNFLGPDDIPAALAFADNLKTAQKQSALTKSILKRWADFDGRAAMDYASKNLRPEQLNEVTGDLLRGWSSSDPIGAFEWFRKEQEKKKEGDESATAIRSWHLSSIFNGLAAADLDSAWNRLGDLEDGNERTAALRGIAQSGMMDGDAQSDLWNRVSSLEDESERGAGQKILVQQVAQMDPLGAADLVMQIEDSATRESLVGNVASSWMLSDPDEAGEWLLENTSAENQGNAIRDAVEQWTYMDPEGAISWLESIEERADTQPATIRLVDRLRAVDPAQAWGYIDRIEDETARLRAMRDTYQHWNHLDSDAASAALQATGLTPEQLKQAQTAPQSPTSIPDEGRP